jgi:predicted nucleotidyltransferase component of viral defense system
MHPDKIRNTIITSIFSNDDFLDILTLKGGIAMRLLDLTNRESSDLDFSITEGKRLSKEIEGKQIEKQLNQSFEEIGYKVISLKFSDKPLKRKVITPPYWGGYQIEFSIISLDKFHDLNEKQKSNINAYGESIENGKKKIKIDLSFEEYTKPRIETQLNDYTIYLYSPIMIVYEKIRASCQQLPEYKLGTEKARARDLYDIYTMLTHKKQIDLKNEVFNEDNFYIIKKMFELKNVDFPLMLKLETIKHDLSSDYENNVLPQIPGNQETPSFDYLFSYNNEIFKDLYKQINL